LPPIPIEAALRIRLARAADVDGLARLETAAFSADRLSRRSFAALVRSPSAILLIGRAGDALAGYALVLTRRGSRTARLYSLAVAPAAAGRGIGGRLLAAAEAAAKARGAEHLRLEVRSDNPSAIALYERRGYRRVGALPNYYEDGAEALRYQRRLRQSAVGGAAAARSERRAA
jgi:ribosomal protein S18 acetylase RimI-like enzyme